MAALGGGVSPVRVFWATPRATGYGNRRKRRRGLGRSSPRVQVGLGGRAGGCRRRPAAAHGGAGARGRCWASLALRSPWFDSWGVLRRCYRVRGGSGVAGGEKSGGGSLTGGGAVRRSAAVLDSGLRWRAWCDVEASVRSLKVGPAITALWRRKVIAGDLGGAWARVKRIAQQSRAIPGSGEEAS